MLSFSTCWEKPDRRKPPIGKFLIVDVEDCNPQGCDEIYNVREIACDPYRWARTFQILEDEGLADCAVPTISHLA
jgi:hypothetical protein